MDINRVVPVMEPNGIKQFTLFPDNADPDGWYVVYMLELADGYFYVGRTSCPRRRLENTFAGQELPQFVQAHPPISVPLLFAVRGYNAAETLKEDLMLSACDHHGPSRVRGGNFRADNPDAQWLEMQAGRARGYRWEENWQQSGDPRWASMTLQHWD